MKQKQYPPMSVAEMALSIYAVNNGFMDKVDRQEDRRFRSGAAVVCARRNYKAVLMQDQRRSRSSARNVEAGSRRSAKSSRRREPGRAAMPGVKEIRVKIASIKSTQKITKAMEMVAASKMRKAQERMRATRPYAEKIRRVIGHLRMANSGLQASVPDRARSEVGRLHHHHHRPRPVRRPERQPVQADADRRSRVAEAGRRPCTCA